MNVQIFKDTLFKYLSDLRTLNNISLISKEFLSLIEFKVYDQHIISFGLDYAFYINCPSESIYKKYLHITCVWEYKKYLKALKNKMINNLASAKVAVRWNNNFYRNYEFISKGGIDKKYLKNCKDQRKLFYDDVKFGVYDDYLILLYHSKQDFKSYIKDTIHIINYENEKYFLEILWSKEYITYCINKQITVYTRSHNRSY